MPSPLLVTWYAKMNKTPFPFLGESMSKEKEQICQRIIMKYELNLESKQSWGIRGVAVQTRGTKYLLAGGRRAATEGRPWWEGGTASDTK